jgi:hypothetical protein
MTRRVTWPWGICISSTLYVDFCFIRWPSTFHRFIAVILHYTLLYLVNIFLS